MSRTILVTGGTDGIGNEVCRRLAAAGHHVVLHGRSLAKAKAAADAITAACKPKSVVVDAVAADLGNLGQVRALISEITTNEKYSGLSVLVNNAGICAQRFEASADGFELDFQVNHLAHFVLSAGLLPLLKQTQPSRVVNVSSGAHAGVGSAFDWGLVTEASKFSSMSSYAMSKAAQICFTAQLATRLGPSSGVTVTSLHPGVIDTKLLREGFGYKGSPLSEGANNVLQLAVGPEGGDPKYHGAYFSGGRATKPCNLVLKPAVQADVWTVSETLAKVTFAV